MIVVVDSPKVLWPVLVTFLAPLAILATGRDRNVLEAVSMIAGAAAAVLVLCLAPAVLSGVIYRHELFHIIPGLTVAFACDGLGLIFAFIAPFLWILATSYNIGYMRTLKEHAQTRYYFCFGVAIFGAVGVALSANVFTLYLFYEIISVFTYPLVAHHQDEEGFFGAKKYLVYLMGTSKLFLLPAMILTYALAGTLDFNLGDVAKGLFPPEVVAESPNLVRLTYVLFIAGLAKAALMPFHNWLPSAMVAPTPVSALLHAGAVVKAGVYSVSRIILSVFGTDAMTGLGLSLPTAYVAAFTIVAASLVALTKDDIKARLAYSTVSQLSYVVIGVALAAPAAVQGGLMHIGHHAFSKITLFFGAGAIYVASHLKSIKLMNGLGRKMPWTFGAFGLASLSMIGMPPVCGFVSKWYLVNGALDRGQTVLLAALLLSTILNAGYFVPIFYRAFFLAPAEGVDIESYREAPPSMVVPLVLTALVSLALGLYPGIFQSFIRTFGSY